MPKPVLPLGCICPLCRKKLTQMEIDSFTVTIAKSSTTLKWRCYHAACTLEQKSINKDKFIIMLSSLTVYERNCVLVSIANFATAKKAVKLQLAADAVEMEDGPLDDEPELDEEESEA